jgi:hypothetical protein
MLQYLDCVLQLISFHEEYQMNWSVSGSGPIKKVKRSLNKQIKALPVLNEAEEKLRKSAFRLLKAVLKAQPVNCVVNVAVGGNSNGSAHNINVSVNTATIDVPNAEAAAA